MDPLSPKPQLTPLLPNAVLDRLGRLRILARSARTNRTRGEHLSGKGGSSTEFSDYRDYSPGDDTRFVDWNIFSRLHRPYLKQFHQEEVRHVVILVDASASMQFEQKLERARQLAAALGLIGLQNNERVSVYASHQAEGATDRLLPCTGRASRTKMLDFIERIDGRGDAPLEKAIESLLKYHSGRGVCLIISDYLTFGDLKRGFNMLYATGLEPMGVQILGPSEIEPEMAGDVRLVDSETQAALDVSAASDLLAIYQEYRLDLEAQLTQLCQRRSGRFLSISSAEAVETVLFDLMRRKGWIQ